jgi:hypothetical protein
MKQTSKTMAALLGLSLTLFAGGVRAGDGNPPRSGDKDGLAVSADEGVSHVLEGEEYLKSDKYFGTSGGGFSGLSKQPPLRVSPSRDSDGGAEDSVAASGKVQPSDPTLEYVLAGVIAFAALSLATAVGMVGFVQWRQRRMVKKLRLFPLMQLDESASASIALADDEKTGLEAPFRREDKNIPKNRAA